MRHSLRGQKRRSLSEIMVHNQNYKVTDEQATDSGTCDWSGSNVFLLRSVFSTIERV